MWVICTHDSRVAIIVALFCSLWIIQYGPREDDNLPQIYIKQIGHNSKSQPWIEWPHSATSHTTLPPVKDINIYISKSLGMQHESLSIWEFKSCRNCDTILPVLAKLVQSDTSVYSPYSMRGGIWPWTVLWIQVSGHGPHTASKVMTAALSMPGCLSLQ